MEPAAEQVRFQGYPHAALAPHLLHAWVVVLRGPLRVTLRRVHRLRRRMVRVAHCLLLRRLQGQSYLYALVPVHFIMPDTTAGKGLHLTTRQTLNRQSRADGHDRRG